MTTRTQSTASSERGEQLRLALDMAPEPIRERVPDVHSRPRVKSSKDAAPQRVTPSEAWGWPLVEAHPPNCRIGIIADIDGGPCAIDDLWLDVRIPTPSWATINPPTGHVHAFWGLARSLLTGSDMRLGPMRTYDRVAGWLLEAVGSDAGYAGVFTRSPLHHRHRAFWSSLDNEEPPKRSLTELARYIPRGWRRRRAIETDYSGLGRNCEVFSAARSWAMRPANLELGCEFAPTLQFIEDYGRRHHAEHPRGWLLLPETGYIAKSSVGYSRRGMAQRGRGWLPFPDLQAVRGRRSGVARRKRTADRDARIVELVGRGWSQRRIAAAVGVSRGTVECVLRRGVV